jgi:uncharacterized membrane protein (UPF0127 family)
MAKMDIKIGGKKFKVDVARTDEEKAKGLQEKNSLPNDEGMLFFFDEPEEVSMWMKDTTIPLDIIFINENLEVSAIHTGVPKSEEFMTKKDTSFVLEINENSGIKIGDELEFSPDIKIRSDRMVVLNEDGSPQMELEGGERIFSRPNTKILIKFAKKAAASGKDNDYKALGKRVFKFLRAQNDSDPEYVTKK